MKKKRFNSFFLLITPSLSLSSVTTFASSATTRERIILPPRRTTRRSSVTSQPRAVCGPLQPMNIVVLGGKEPARASLAPPPNNHQEAAPPAGEGRPLLLITGAEKERGLPCHRQKRMSARGKSRLGMNGFSASAGGRLVHPHK